MCWRIKLSQLAGSPFWAPAVVGSIGHEKLCLWCWGHLWEPICYVQDSWAKSSFGLKRSNPANGSFDCLESGFALQFLKSLYMVCLQLWSSVFKKCLRITAVTNWVDIKVYITSLFWVEKLLNIESRQTYWPLVICLEKVFWKAWIEK